MMGSALLTLLIGLYAHRSTGRRLLLGACILMAATGAAFALVTNFWPLLIVAFVGTINPSAGDISIFLPIEQALLAGSISPGRRTVLFSRYSFLGALAGAFGTLSGAVPGLLAKKIAIDETAILQYVFWFYAAIGMAAWVIYRSLPSRDTETGKREHRALNHS